jgi:hypothetical protein
MRSLTTRLSGLRFPKLLAATVLMAVAVSPGHALHW